MLIAALCVAAAQNAWAANTPKTVFSDTKPIAVEMAAPNPDAPITLEAERMGYDQKSKIVVAEGAVEVVQGDYVLRADQITYYQTEGLVRADGNVSLLQPNGDVFFSDHVELTGEMKTGVVQNFRARLSDNSVFAANEAERVNPAVLIMKQAVYSPCKLCKDEEPFWQVKAQQVKVDNAEERVSYKHAQLEFAGVPVFYAPRFSHPTPDAGAKSGFLRAENSQNSLLGTMVKVPYYWRIDHDKEATITPWYMSEEGMLLQTDYAQLTDGGTFDINASGTIPDARDSAGRVVDGSSFRGHVFARGLQNRSDYSRWGFDVQRSTDDTYLRRYGYSSERSLTSRVFAETAVGRNYGLAESMVFQGLQRDDDPSITPRILPSLDGYYETDPLAGGARLHVGANLQNLARPESSEYKRASFTTGASLPYVTGGGHVLKAELSMRTDAYSIDEQSITDGGTTTQFDGEKYRAIPQAALTWRYPLITQVNDASLTLEPIAVAIAQPAGGNPLEIPNEDNRVVELTDTNIFATQRMPGYDTVDSGSRVAYGFRSQMLFPQGQTIDAMLGQSYNADETPFPNSQTLGEEFSDYIGSVGLGYAPVNISYRFALDRDSLAATRSELWSSYVQPRFQLTGAYLTIENNPYVRDSEEIFGSTLVKLDDTWSLYGSGRRDLKLNAALSATGGIIYANECFSLLTQLQRIYTRDRDIEPSTEISLRFGFKNFGEIGNN